ncbi:hypothetical protein L596_010360 [Steinernema carpocapsae]|uniref:Uncharacterized protein n=1 Tax=Steinernema carpocapsae TaxID=34508 RepID=A0A4V6A6V2_STECR|nr:hypothetical protein L596_010360 [Steinernema carpocapsae]
MRRVLAHNRFSFQPISFLVALLNFPTLKTTHKRLSEACVLIVLKLLRSTTFFCFVNNTISPVPLLFTTRNTIELSTTRSQKTSLEASTKGEDQVKHGPSNNLVLVDALVVIHLLSGKDQPLLGRRYSFLLLDLLL